MGNWVRKSQNVLWATIVKCLALVLTSKSIQFQVSDLHTYILDLVHTVDTVHTHDSRLRTCVYPATFSTVKLIK